MSVKTTCPLSLRLIGHTMRAYGMCLVMLRVIVTNFQVIDYRDRKAPALDYSVAFDGACRVFSMYINMVRMSKQTRCRSHRMSTVQLDPGPASVLWTLLKTTSTFKTKPYIV